MPNRTPLEDVIEATGYAVILFALIALGTILALGYCQ